MEISNQTYQVSGNLIDFFFMRHAVSNLRI